MFPPSAGLGIANVRSGWADASANMLSESRVIIREHDLIGIWGKRSHCPVLRPLVEEIEIKCQKHGCPTGSSTPNAPIKTPEARSPFSDFCSRRLYIITWATSQPREKSIETRRLGTSYAGGRFNSDTSLKICYKSPACAERTQGVS